MLYIFFSRKDTVFKKARLKLGLKLYSMSVLYHLACIYRYGAQTKDTRKTCTDHRGQERPAFIFLVVLVLIVLVLAN